MRMGTSLMSLLRKGNSAKPSFPSTKKLIFKVPVSGSSFLQESKAVSTRVSRMILFSMIQLFSQSNEGQA